MAKLDQLKSTTVWRQMRYFSEDFKRKKVNEIDRRLTSVSEICKEYGVSHPSVYKWIYKYSLMRKKGVKMVVEAQSDTTKIKALKERIAELEQLLGQKQFEVEFLEKLIEIASDQYGVDLKKKVSGKPLSGSGNTEKNTDSR